VGGSTFCKRNARENYQATFIWTEFVVLGACGLPLIGRFSGLSPIVRDELLCGEWLGDGKGTMAQQLVDQRALAAPGALDFLFLRSRASCCEGQLLRRRTMLQRGDHAP
jgi:hypothetical protein